MLLRAARAADADAVAAVFLASRAAAMPWLPDLHTAEETRSWIERDVLGRCRTWVAVDTDSDAEEIVGFAAVTEGHLEHLYLHPSRRRQGIGTMLFRRVQAANPAGFTFWVFQRNSAARAFYEHHGCRVLESTDGSGNDEREPDLRYGWTP